MALRFLWTKDKDMITARDNPFNTQDVKLHSPCSKLCKVGEKYTCSVWNKERPDFCNTHPDNVFKGVEKWNREKIQKIIDWMKPDCPLFEDITVDDVIEKVLEVKKDG